MFGAIYVGAIPFFSAVDRLAGTAIARRKVDRRAGTMRGILLWVWVGLGLLIAYGVVSTIRDILNRVRD